MLGPQRAGFGPAEGRETQDLRMIKELNKQSQQTPAWYDAL